MKPLDAIRERRRRELEADRATRTWRGLRRACWCGTVADTRAMRGIFAWLEPEFTMAALRLAFKRCALKVHPDKARGNDLEFQRLVKAYTL
jgi:hypothetical protein